MIVTGASRGIGKAIALKLAGEEYAIKVNFVKSKAEAENVVTEIRNNNGKAIAVQADLSKYADMERLFTGAQKSFGGIDIVVNNAGVSKVKLLAESDDELFDNIFNIKMYAAP